MNNLLFLLFIIIYLQIANSEPKIITDTDHSYSFNALKISNNGEVFYPSFYGGVSVIDKKGVIYHPWSDNVKFKLIKKSITGDIKDAEWIMYKDNDFYFHYEMSFTQQMNNVTIHMKDLGTIADGNLPKDYADVIAVYLDRSSQSANPVIIGVPYLTTFNLLLSNDCFISLYFDWNKTNASEIKPYNSIYSDSSVYFSQYALYNPLTNGKRNKLDETIYLKVSDNVDDVLPYLPNPVSKFKKESSGRVVFDDWGSFDKSISNLKSISEAGISNVWHIVHDWQKSGYDVALPDVYPANSKYGGNEGLISVSNYDRQLGFLFALHENYIDIFKASSKFRPENLALNSNSTFIFDWYNGDTSFLVKPTAILNNLVPISEQIHETFKTNSSYHDVSASYDPSKYVDYDYKTFGAGKFTTPYNTFKDLADTMRYIHNGPVSSEGLAHFLYVGYYDDICAQIHTAQSLPGSYGTEKEGGFYKPLFVDFDLLRMKEKATVHGVGYYERFFYKDNYWQYMGRSKDSALMYTATELAYGHGAFFSTESYNFVDQGLIEYNSVYPVQQRYSNSEVVKILYNDNGNLISASDYIRKYPNTFDKFESDNFMSQVYIEYDNGLKIFVNRHPTKKWDINYHNIYGYYSAHVLFEGKDLLLNGNRIGEDYILPAGNGWLCYCTR